MGTGNGIQQPSAPSTTADLGKLDELPPKKGADQAEQLAWKLIKTTLASMLNAARTAESAAQEIANQAKIVERFKKAAEQAREAADNALATTLTVDLRDSLSAARSKAQEVEQDSVATNYINSYKISAANAFQKLMAMHDKFDKLMKLDCDTGIELIAQDAQCAMKDVTHLSGQAELALDMAKTIAERVKNALIEAEKTIDSICKQSAKKKPLVANPRSSKTSKKVGQQTTTTKSRQTVATATQAVKDSVTRAKQATTLAEAALVEAINNSKILSRLFPDQPFPNMREQVDDAKEAAQEAKNARDALINSKQSAGDAKRLAEKADAAREVAEAAAYKTAKILEAARREKEAQSQPKRVPSEPELPKPEPVLQPEPKPQPKPVALVPASVPQKLEPPQPRPKRELPQPPSTKPELGLQQPQQPKSEQQSQQPKPSSEQNPEPKQEPVFQQPPAPKPKPQIKSKPNKLKSKPKPQQSAQPQPASVKVAIKVPPKPPTRFWKYVSAIVVGILVDAIVFASLFTLSSLVLPVIVGITIGASVAAMLMTALSYDPIKRLINRGKTTKANKEKTDALPSTRLNSVQALKVLQAKPSIAKAKHPNAKNVFPRTPIGRAMPVPDARVTTEIKHVRGP